MCRSIKSLFNIDPPATPDEIREASLQFVRKVTGFAKPSKENESAFRLAVDDIARDATPLLRSLQTAAPARNREAMAAAARRKSQKRWRGVL